MTLIWAKETVLGLAADRPLAGDPRLAATTDAASLYIATDTGDVSASNGQQWAPQGTIGHTFANADPAGVALQATSGQTRLQNLALTGIATKTANYPLAVTDSIIIANAASLTVTIPAANATGIAAGRLVIVKNGASGTGTTVASAGGTIDGATTATLTSAYDVLRVVSDGTNWLTI